jgi:hypothetical protein
MVGKAVAYSCTCGWQALLVCTTTHRNLRLDLVIVLRCLQVIHTPGVAARGDTGWPLQSHTSDMSQADCVLLL